MKKLFFAFGLLSLASAARADIADSGNSTIGGNSIVQGTMTVQGNAFSVGGSTFSVKEGTAAFGGLIQASSLGIKWADGSTSTTAASGGVGNVTTSGANVMTGSIRFGPSGFTNSGSIDTTGQLYNGWQVAASTYVVNQPAVTFTGLASSTTYRVYTQGGRIDGAASSAVWRIRFGNGSVDSGSHYYTEGAGFNQSGSGYSVGSGGATTTGCFAQNTTGTMSIGDPIQFQIGPFRTTQHIVNNVETFVDTGGCYAGCAAGYSEHQFCVWGPAASSTGLDRISIVAPGTSGFTGWVFLEQLSNPNAQ